MELTIIDRASLLAPRACNSAAITRSAADWQVSLWRVGTVKEGGATALLVGSEAKRSKADACEQGRL
jgi:hypothetical protein